MTMKSCFYPLLGDRVFGLLGDIIDILSVVATMFGVCTSLGLGVIQLNYGFRRINRKVEISIGNQIITIWGITALATASVISGIKLGIRRLSEICFAIGKLFLVPCFVCWPNSQIAKDVELNRDIFCIDNIPLLLVDTRRLSS